MAMSSRLVRGAILLAASLLMSGCVTTWQVDPAVLDEVRGVGKVIGEVTYDGIWENTNDIVTTFVIDVGGRSGPDSVDKAVDLLGERGWRTSLDDLPASVTMRSPKWGDDQLLVRPFHPREVKNQPELEEEIWKKSPDPEALVIVLAWEGAAED